MQPRSAWGRSSCSSPQGMGHVWGYPGLPSMLLHMRWRCFLFSLPSPHSWQPSHTPHPSLSLLSLSLLGLIQAHCQNGESKSAEVIGCRRPWKVLCLVKMAVKFLTNSNGGYWRWFKKGFCWLIYNQLLK